MTSPTRNTRTSRTHSQPAARSRQGEQASARSRQGEQASARSRQGDRPARPGRRQRTKTRQSDAARPRTAPSSDLERALNAAQKQISTNLPTSFAGLGLPDALVTTLARRGMHAPFAIQARTLLDALAGRDVLGRAQTGSGKTLAFGVPAIGRLCGAGRHSGRAPRGLVLVPTRELAQQVTDALAPLGAPLGLRIIPVYGGAPMGRQIDNLRRGVDIVVATPGRLVDLIEQGECRLDQIELTVLDEADYMADLGFLPVVTKLLNLTPEGGQRMLFSATLDRGVDKLAHAYLTDPAFHAVADAAAPVDSADHRVFTLSHDNKLPVLTRMMARPGRSLLFVRTKHGADRLAKQLIRSGVGAAAIHGNLSQSQRTRALSGFAAGFPRVLVATDVAARGIHVDDVDLVVHVDPPADHKDYLHRSGRTARAGASGTVVSLVLDEQAHEVAALHRDAQVNVRTDAVSPGAAAVSEIAVSGTPIVPRSPAANKPARKPASGPVRSARPPRVRRSAGYAQHR